MTRRPAALLICLAVTGTSGAQELRDPTRPPSFSPESSAETAAGSRLQSVILSTRRKLALIDGQPVHLGGRVGDAVLIALSETEAVLQRGAEVERLRLVPGIDKKRSATARPSAPLPAGADGGSK
jgi:MSHA biogenesis protein MshK